MKSQYNLSLCLFFISIVSFGGVSCKKEASNIFNMFDVTLDLNSNSSYSLKENQTLNEGDSIYFDFTIKSPTKDMYQVAIFQIGAALPNLRITLKESEKNSYSGVVKGVVGANGFGNLKDGVNTFRIWAYDRQGIYLGDGYKTIAINVNNKYTHIVNKKIYFPHVDSINGSAKSYISLSTGETFNYQTAAANSQKIDMGIYRVFSRMNGNDSVFGLRIYSLSAIPLPYQAFDISSWVKRATKFAAAQTGQNTNFLRSYTSAATISAYAKGRNPNLTSLTTDVPVNGVIPFLTPEGKYGLVLINQIDQSKSDPFVDVSVKFEN